MKSAAGLCALLLVCALSRGALASPVRIAPAPDGRVGAWLLAGPFGRAAAREASERLGADLALGRSPVPPSTTTRATRVPPVLRLVTGRGAPIDLGAALGKVPSEDRKSVV